MNIDIIIITYILYSINAWTGILTMGITGNVIRANLNHKKIRKSDILHLGCLSAIAVGLFSGTIWFPDIIQLIPSGMLFFEIGVIPILIYISEKHWKDWTRLCNNIKHIQNS